MENESMQLTDEKPVNFTWYEYFKSGTVHSEQWFAEQNQQHIQKQRDYTENQIKRNIEKLSEAEQALDDALADYISEELQGRGYEIRVTSHIRLDNSITDISLEEKGTQVALVLMAIKFKSNCKTHKQARILI